METVYMLTGISEEDREQLAEELAEYSPSFVRGTFGDEEAFFITGSLPPFLPVSVEAKEVLSPAALKAVFNGREIGE